MAGEFVTLVLDAVVDMHPSAKLVLVALADHANRNGSGLAYPSNATLVRRTGICERQVRDHLRECEAKGHIKRRTAGVGGRGQATTYQLQLAEMVRSLPTEKAAMHCRVLQELPGTLPPGFSLRENVNPAVQTTNPAVSSPKPGSPPPETRRPTAPEPEVEPVLTRKEPEGVFPQTVFKKLNGEPEKPQRPHMTREEQIEAARRLDQQAKENTARRIAEQTSAPTARFQNEFERAKQRWQTEHNRRARAAAKRTGQ